MRIHEKAFRASKVPRVEVVNLSPVMAACLVNIWEHWGWRSPGGMAFTALHSVTRRWGVAVYRTFSLEEERATLRSFREEMRAHIQNPTSNIEHPMEEGEAR